MRLSVYAKYLLPALLMVATGTLAFHSDDASATLRRLPRTWLYGPQAVWSDGTTSDVFHPMSDPMESAGLLNVRVAYELGQDTGDCRLRPAVRYSDDGVSWNAAKPIYTGVPDRKRYYRRRSLC